MLRNVDPRELRLPPRSTFSPRDLSTYDDIENAAAKIANECLEKYEQNRTEVSPENPVGFTSQLGWSPQGEQIRFASVYVCLFAQRMAESIRVDWSYRCISLGNRVGYRYQSAVCISRNPLVLQPFERKQDNKLIYSLIDATISAMFLPLDSRNGSRIPRLLAKVIALPPLEAIAEPLHDRQHLSCPLPCCLDTSLAGKQKTLVCCHLVRSHIHRIEYEHKGTHESTGESAIVSSLSI